MTAGEYEARLKIVKFLIWTKQTWESGRKDNNKVNNYRDPYVHIQELELQTGVKAAVIRSALKHCTLITSKTGKRGGYKLSIAPEELWPKAEKIYKRNKGIKNPSKWVHRVPLTLYDLMGEYLVKVIVKGLSDTAVKETLISQIKKTLEDQVLYTYQVGTFIQNYA